MAKLAEPRCSVGCLGLGVDVFKRVGSGERSLATLGYPWGFRCGLFMRSIGLLTPAARVIPNFLMPGIIFIGGIPKFSSGLITVGSIILPLLGIMLNLAQTVLQYGFVRDYSALSSTS